MKFILTNTDEGFTPHHYKDICVGKPDFKLILPDLNGGLRRIIDIAIDDYPSLNKFSIKGDTLYWGLQWIGTLSNQQATMPNLYFNHKAHDCLVEYVLLSRMTEAVPKTSNSPVMLPFKLDVKPVFSLGFTDKSRTKEYNVSKRESAFKIKNKTRKFNRLFSCATRSQNALVNDDTQLQSVDGCSAMSMDCFKPGSSPHR